MVQARRRRGGGGEPVQRDVGEHAVVVDRVAVFAQDSTQSVRPLAELRYDIAHWSEFDRGGHFAAMEVPELLAADVRRFFLERLGSRSARH